MSEDIHVTNHKYVPYIKGVLTLYPENSKMNPKVRVRPLESTQIYMLSSRKSFHVRQITHYLDI